MPDMPTPNIAMPDIAFDYTLTIDHCAERYAIAGHARTVRTIQRYCKNGALDARKVTTLTGDKFLVTPHSLHRHIEELNQLAAQTATIGQGWTAYDTLGDQARHRRQPTPLVATSQPATPHENLPSPHPVVDDIEPTTQDDVPLPLPTEPDAPRHDAPGRAASPEASTQHAAELAFLRDQIGIKDGQLTVKDRQLEAKDAQIVALLDRNKESNVLIQTMQQLLKPLLPHLRSPEQGSSPTPSSTGEPVLH